MLKHNVIEILSGLIQVKFVEFDRRGEKLRCKLTQRLIFSTRSIFALFADFIAKQLWRKKSISVGR